MNNPDSYEGGAGQDGSFNNKRFDYPSTCTVCLRLRLVTRSSRMESYMRRSPSPGRKSAAGRRNSDNRSSRISVRPFFRQWHPLALLPRGRWFRVVRNDVTLVVLGRRRLSSRHSMTRPIGNASRAFSTLTRSGATRDPVSSADASPLARGSLIVSRQGHVESIPDWPRARESRSLPNKNAVNSTGIS